MTLPIRNVLPEEENRSDIIPIGNESYYLNIDHMTMSERLTKPIDAVAQAIFVTLSTERYASPIYPQEFGIQTRDLIGKHIDYVIPVMKKRIKNALTYDDRILNVDSFDFKEMDDALFVSFKCTTIYGPLVLKEIQIVPKRPVIIIDSGTPTEEEYTNEPPTKKEYTNSVIQQQAGTLDHNIPMNPILIERVELLNTRVVLTSGTRVAFTLGDVELFLYADTSGGGALHYLSERLPVRRINGHPNYENATMDFTFIPVSITEMSLEILYKRGTTSQTYTIDKRINKELFLRPLSFKYIAGSVGSINKITFDYKITYWG